MSLALSLHAPWAWAIFHAGKDIENRSWSPPKKLIGQRFFVHVSNWGSFDQLYDEFVYVRECIERSAVSFSSLPTVSINDLKRLKGHVIGSALLDGVVHSGGAFEFVSPWWVGPVGFRIKEPRLLASPVPCRGRLGFFEVNVPLEAI